MQLFKCCCGWSYVIGNKKVYGAIYPIGIGSFPEALANTQRMMTRKTFKKWYSDCWRCWKGYHHHVHNAIPKELR